MPRRKKKKRNSSELPRLRFLESPSNQSPQRLSPEFGAINPVTAKTVPIEAIKDLSWVTPQFGDRSLNRHYNSNITRTTRVANRLRESKSTDGRHRSPDSYNVASRYKPLTFITGRDSYPRKSKNKKLSSDGDEPIRGHVNENGQTKLTATVTNSDSYMSPFTDITHDDLSLNNQSLRILTPVLSHNSRLDGENESYCGYVSDSGRQDGDIRDCLDGANVSVSVKKGSNSHEQSVVFGKVQKNRPFLLDLSSSPPPSPSPEILVTDTPECDYDLTLRQRQMKYLLRKNSKLL